MKTLFNEYSSKSIPSKAYLISDKAAAKDSPFVPNLIKVNWQYRDAIQLKTVSFQKSYLCTKDMKIVDVGLPEELSGEYVSNRCDQPF